MEFPTQEEMLRMDVLTDVDKERTRQDQMWGKQRHDLGDWLKILIEEVGEVAQAMQKEKDWGKDSDASDLYEELIHAAAVAVAIAEQVKEKERDELERD
jgi:NTP pyrophosphatase (non-canonical NTP hydrolase)